jgi:hypothetical protein
VDLNYDSTNDLWFLSCSCCTFERCGYGCPHTDCVLQLQVPEWKGYTAEDVSSHWLAIHFCYGHREIAKGEGHKCISAAIRFLQVHDTSGPRFPIQSLPEFEEEPDLSRKDLAQATPHVQNYTSSKVEEVLRKYSHFIVSESGLVTNFGQVTGTLSQESYVVGEWHEENLVTENQLHDFLRKTVVDVARPTSRTELKGDLEEMFSVIDGSPNLRFRMDEAKAMIRDYVARVRSECHENNSGGKRSAIVSYNQERESKKCRQYVANNGIR